MFVGIDAADGQLDDFVLEFNYAANPIALVGGKPLLYPIPSSLRAVCNGNQLTGIYGVTIQADSEDRETAMASCGRALP